MTKLRELKKHLRSGEVSSAGSRPMVVSVDRHLRQMLAEGYLTKLSTGVYHRPKQTAFGKAPAEDDALGRGFSEG